MGNSYRFLEKFPDLSCNPNSDIVVEIGSGIGEGSTQWLYEWATQRNLPFYSIDVIDDTSRALADLDINFVISVGHEWCRDVLPTLHKTIKVLYLDNFDYIWESTPENLEVWGDKKDIMLNWFEKQRQEYANRGVDLTRENSMEEHRLQTMYCLPYMSDESVILMDDTLSNVHGPYGKCATALPLMIDAGYSLDQQHVKESSSYRYVYRKKQ